MKQCSWCCRGCQCPLRGIGLAQGGRDTSRSYWVIGLVRGRTRHVASLLGHRAGTGVDATRRVPTVRVMGSSQKRGLGGLGVRAGRTVSPHGANSQFARRELFGVSEGVTSVADEED